MSDAHRPATPPRHSMRTAAASSASYLSWLPLARQTARIRAIASSALVPHERAMADATVLTAWLTTAQRLEYAPTLRAGSDAEEFVARLADERRVVLEGRSEERRVGKECTCGRGAGAWGGGEVCGVVGEWMQQ